MQYYGALSLSLSWISLAARTVCDGEKRKKKTSTMDELEGFKKDAIDGDYTSTMTRTDQLTHTRLSGSSAVFFYTCARMHTPSEDSYSWKNGRGKKN